MHKTWVIQKGNSAKQKSSCMKINLSSLSFHSCIPKTLHEIKDTGENIFFPLLTAGLDLQYGLQNQLFFCSLELTWHLFLWAGYFFLAFVVCMWSQMLLIALNYPNTAKIQQNQLIRIPCYLQHEVLFPARFTSFSVYCSAF